MSVLGITSAAIALARKAVHTASAARDTELEGQLADLVVHLGVLKAQCVVLVNENQALRGGPAGSEAEVEVTDDADWPSPHLV